MKYMMLLLAAALILGVSAKPATSRGNSALTLDDSNHYVEHNFVENQPDAVNPTDCFWTFDDNWQAFGSGYMDAGASIVRSHCLVADWTAHQLGINITAPSSSLVVTFRYDPWGVVYTIPAKPVGGNYQYRGCVIGPRWTLDLASLPEVPNANGGRGFMSSFTITVTNPTNKRISKIDAGFEFGSPGVLPRREAYCQDHPTDDFHLDNFVWGARL